MENGDTAIVNDCCQKVACTFRGQIWNVWYTLNIPISDSPWNYAGCLVLFCMQRIHKA